MIQDLWYQKASWYCVEIKRFKADQSEHMLKMLQGYSACLKGNEF